MSGIGAVQAAPDQPVFGPTAYTRTNGAPQVVTANFALPADIAAPYLLRIESGLPDGSKRVSSATVSVNGVQVAGPNDFNQKVQLIERSVALSPGNQVEVRLAGSPGGHLTITVLGTVPLTVPVTVSPTP